MKRKVKDKKLHDNKMLALYLSMKHACDVFLKAFCAASVEKRQKTLYEVQLT